MADNTAQGGTDTIATDDVTTLNGAGSTGVKVERVKVMFGDDGTARDASAAFPLPTVNKVQSLTLTTGSITGSGQSVTATTDVANAGSITVVIGGTYAGVNVTFEASVDGTTWVGLIGQRTDSYVTEVSSGVLPSNQIRAWDFPMPGFTQFRVRSTAYTSGTAAVAISPAVNPFEIAPTVGNAQAATATQSGVSASATSVTILAANAARRGATIHNDSASATLYIRLSSSAAAATSGNYTTMMPPGSYYEVPFNYSGQITGIWTAATGFANVTEVV